MNLYQKNISLVLCIIIIFAIEACKKDSNITQASSQNHLVNHGTDFRDSLIGRYFLAFYQQNSYGLGIPSTLEANGFGIVMVSKSFTDDSTIILNINNSSASIDTLPYYTSPLSLYCPQPAFKNPIAFLSGSRHQVFFNAQKDSINYIYNDYYGGGSTNLYFYCVGYKQ